MSQFVSVATAEEIPDGQVLVVVVGGKEIAIFRVEGRFYAVDNTCPHLGGPIGEGELQGSLITCPWHAWTFELETGLCTINPAAKLETYQVSVQNGKVHVAV